MSLRKEQVLAMLALAVGLYYISNQEQATTPSLATGRPRSYDPPALPISPLVDPDADARLLTRDVFVEPAETRPLPPRDLSLPPVRVFGVVSLPLVEDAAWAHLLEFGGVPDEGVELAEPGSGSPRRRRLRVGRCGGSPTATSSWHGPMPSWTRASAPTGG